MLCLQHIELMGDFHAVHVPGTWMIEEGADDGSRGNLIQSAIMAGHSVISFEPLHLFTLEQLDSLQQ